VEILKLVDAETNGARVAFVSFNHPQVHKQVLGKKPAQLQRTDCALEVLHPLENVYELAIISRKESEFLGLGRRCRFARDRRIGSDSKIEAVGLPKYSAKKTMARLI
jgi:hypothetical protein